MLAPSLSSAVRCAATVLAFLAMASTAARAQVSVLSSTVEEHTAAAGESYIGRITISNPGASAEVVRIYQTDYNFSSDGTSNFDAPGQRPRSNASWISVQASQVTVPAGTSISVPYTVGIPAVDSLRGTYWSAIMVEAATKPPANLDPANKLQVGIGTVIRYAVQVATHVGSSGTRVVKFTGTAASQAPEGNAAVDLDVQDVGERGYRPVLWIEVYDAKGVLRAKAKQSRGLLYPGTSLHQHFVLGKLPSGTYKAVIFADTGEDSVYAAQYTVIF